MNEMIRSSSDLQQEMIHSIIERIQKFKNSSHQIKPQSLLQQDLNISSLEMISLITDLCDEFSIDITTISDVDLAKMKRIIDITSVLVLKK